jgi:hypothetical protein
VSERLSAKLARGSILVAAHVGCQDYARWDKHDSKAAGSAQQVVDSRQLLLLWLLLQLFLLLDVTVCAPHPVSAKAGCLSNNNNKRKHVDPVELVCKVATLHQHSTQQTHTLTVSNC